MIHATKDMKSLLRQMDINIDLNIIYKDLYDNLNTKYKNLKNLSENGFLWINIRYKHNFGKDLGVLCKIEF
jgi:hypothetical protein